LNEITVAIEQPKDIPVLTTDDFTDDFTDIFFLCYFVFGANYAQRSGSTKLPDTIIILFR